MRYILANFATRSDILIDYHILCHVLGKNEKRSDNLEILPKANMIAGSSIVFT